MLKANLNTNQTAKFSRRSACPVAHSAGFAMRGDWLLIRGKVMATLYKHGELGQIEKLDHKLAFCADGQILRNDGDGWKCWKKLKAGIDAREHFERMKLKYSEKLSSLPCFAAWRELMHELVPFKLRNLTLRTISMMPGDPDGVCSELGDFGYLTGDDTGLSLDDCCRLCSAYRVAMLESKFDAQVELANKRFQADWRIKQTENGWFVVVREPYPDEASRNWFRGTD